MPPAKRSRSSKNTQPSSSPPKLTPTLKVQKFISEEAKERVEEIKSYEIVGERKFDVVNLTKYPMFETMLKQRGWESFNNMVTDESNRTVTLEFFANARFSSNLYTSFVRGKTIDFSPEAINQLLGLQAPEICDVKKRRSEVGDLTKEEWDTMLTELGREGARWRGQAGRTPQRLNTAELKPVPKAWASFITSTLESTSCSSELPIKRVFTLVSILSGNPINVGELIATNISEMARSKVTTLGYSCLINWLCENQQVPLFRSDIDVTSKEPINDKAMLVYERANVKYMSELEQRRRPQGEQVEQPQMMNGESSQQVPQHEQLHPMVIDFMFGFANWARDVSSQLYIDPPYFSQQFLEAANQYRQGAQRGNAYQRFGTEENMRTYLQEQRRRASAREQQLEADFYRARQEDQDKFIKNLEDASSLDPEDLM